MTTRHRPHTPFGIGAEQLLRMGKLRPSPPTKQAVDREISLDVVNEEQIGVLTRKPGLLHDLGNHLLGPALNDTLCHPGVRIVIRVEQIIVIVCRRALAEGPASVPSSGGAAARASSISASSSANLSS